MIVVAPDKFKGTLSAAEVCNAVRTGIDDREATFIPMADGGDGTLDALVVSRGGVTRTERVRGPLGDPVDAKWGVLPNGAALVEMAQASGLVLVEGRNDPLVASTFGVGELIRAAARAGITEIVVGVGGSATTDGGAGAVEALQGSLRGLSVTVAVDVQTTFVDAAYKFAKQKGASDAQVNLLAKRLEALASRYLIDFGVDVLAVPGSGAAGGLAGGLFAMGARIEPGFDVVSDAVELEAALDGAEMVITGEGKLDATSFEGKVVSGVLELAEQFDVAKRVVICGQATDEGRSGAEKFGAQVLVLTERAFQSAEAFTRAPLLIEEATRSLFT